MESNNLVTDKRMSHFVGIGLALGFLLPHTSTAFLLVNPLLCIFYQCFPRNRVWYSKSWMVIVPLFITFVINIGQNVDIKSQLSFMTIILYVFSFPFIKGVQLKNGYFYFIFFYIFLSQLSNVFHLATVTSFFENYYPISERDMMEYSNMQGHISTSTIFNYRLGGLYHNSNNCSRATSLLLAAYLFSNRDKPIKSMILFISLSVLSILMTGSRTGFFIAGLLISVFLFLKGGVNRYWKWGIAIVFAGVFVYLLAIGSDTFRAFNMSDGLEGSNAKKIATFISYIQHEKSVVRLLFGYLDSSRFERMTIDLLPFFDSDYGELIFKFGICGFSALIIFFYTVFRRVDKMGKAFFIVLLWMISSTIVSSYRAFFIFMLLLSVIYSGSKIKKTS